MGKVVNNRREGEGRQPALSKSRSLRSTTMCTLRVEHGWQSDVMDSCLPLAALSDTRTLSCHVMS